MNSLTQNKDNLISTVSNPSSNISNPSTPSPSPSTPSFSPTVNVKGQRNDKHGFVYITVMGTPEERGYAHGFLLADRIVKMIRTYAFFLWSEYGRDITFFSQMIKDLFEPIVKEKYGEYYLAKYLYPGIHRPTKELDLSK